MLLRLPAMYFTRVARVFEDAEVSKPDIQRMIDAQGGGGIYILSSSSDTVHATAGSVGSDYGLHEPGVARSYGGMTSPPHIAIMEALPVPDDWSPPVVSPALIRFKHSWEAFIDSLMREWKTLNFVSALLLSYVFIFSFSGKRILMRSV